MNNGDGKVEGSSRVKSLVKTAARTIGGSDWSFERMSDDEAKYCYYYEYLRGPLITVADFPLPACDELRSLASLAFSDEIVDRTNKLWPARERVNAILNVAPVIRSDLYKLLQPPWPDVPWLDLTESERKRRFRSGDLIVDEATRAEVEAITGEKVSADDLATARTVSADFVFSEDASVPAPPAPLYHGGAVIHVAGAFRAGAYDNDIVETFRERLKAFAKRHPDAFEQRDRGRSGFKDRLRKLGALRIYCLFLSIYEDAKKSEKHPDRALIEDLLREALETGAEGVCVPKYHGRGLRQVAIEAFREMKALFKSELGNKI